MFNSKFVILLVLLPTLLWAEEANKQSVINRITGGISNTLINFAKCCNPIPGDEIVGYITRGKGVTVHRNTCSNMPVIENEDRFIDVEWNVSSKTLFITRLKIICEDRKNIIRDITEVISNFSMNIQSIDMKAKDGLGYCTLILETRDTKQLLRVKKKIKEIDNVNWLIKPHPRETTYKVVTTTRKLVEKSIYNSKNNIKVFPSDFGNLSLPKIIDVAITQHGSVG